MAKKNKILISAYSVCPGLGSEPGRGFEIATRVAETHSVWVLTTSEFSSETEAFLKTQPPLPNLNLCYFEIPILVNIERFFRDSPLMVFSMNIYYYLWQMAVYFYARKLHKRIGFDLAHHVSWTRYWMPSFLAFLPIPFIFGAVGGADLTPQKLLNSLPLKSKALELMRKLFLRLAELDPFLRLSLQRSALALSITPSTVTQLKKLGAQKVELFTDMGLGDELSSLLETPPAPTKPFRVISVSRLTAWKGLHLSLEAFAKLDDPQAEYWIFGKGSEETTLKKICAGLGIRQSVFFFGQVPRAQILQAYSQCHALLHPSFHETGGWAAVEAMAAGRPVICLDYGGLAEVVSPQTGIKINPSLSAEETVVQFAKALQALRDQPALRESMGSAARQRVKEHFTWPEQINQIKQIYLKTMGPINKVQK